MKKTKTKQDALVMKQTLATTTAKDDDDITTLSPQKTFSFDRTFQEKILQAMIHDKVWGLQFAEVLDINYFEFAHLKLVADKYTGYHKKYKEFPSMELLLTMIKDDLRENSDLGLKNQIKSFLIRVESKQDLGDLSFVKDKSLEFCKKAALQEALLQSVDLVQTEKYDSVIEVVRKALSAGNDQNPGLDLFDDIDARYSDTYRDTIPTGVPELDQKSILNGGLGQGEIGFVVASTGVGKSHLLIHFGANAIKKGKNVIHYTFELNERMVGIRYDSNLTDIPSLDCYNHKKEIHKFYQKNSKDYGRLIVKYFPTGGATTQSLRAHIEKLANTGFVPDMVIVDYAGIMRSADRNEMLRLELKKVCEELRGLAEDLQLPVWTAIQSNKEGANSEVVDLTNLAESYGQAHVADFVLGLTRLSAQKATGFGNVFVAKNRAGIDGIKYHMHLDTARSKIKILTDQEAQEYSQEEENQERLNVLDKFKNLQR